MLIRLLVKKIVRPSREHFGLYPNDKPTLKEWWEVITAKNGQSIRTRCTGYMDFRLYGFNHLDSLVMVKL